MTTLPALDLGVKSDPIEYRYSYEWLFRIMAEEEVRHLQLGTFFEMYQLPDDFFLRLRAQAQDHGIAISSVFTAHRELGGFFRDEPGWAEVARRNFERLIEIGALVGARSVGCNPGAVLRDRMDGKEAGWQRYIAHMQALMAFAKTCGLECLTIEPMSCAAEPPAFPEEIRAMGQELAAYRAQHPGAVPVGFCSDIAHGYLSADASVHFTPFDLLDAALPYLWELHLKNTDARYDATFGFTGAERKRGVVDVPKVRRYLLEHAAALPQATVIGYLEIGGPKLGRDYSDPRLEAQLRESLRYLKETFVGGHSPGATVNSGEETPAAAAAPPLVQIAPSLMCADLCNLEASVRDLERAGADMLHIDIMDARFTPNMPLGLEVWRALSERTALPMDVHLMVEDNDFFVERFAEVGVRMLSVHAESCRHVDRTLSRIRELGMHAGLALNPATPLSVLEYVLNRIDYVLIMTVNPGYAGQRLAPSALKKIADCRRYLRARKCHVPIEVDGNVSFDHIAPMVAAGADILVAGTSSVYHPSGSLAANFRRARAGIQEGLARR